jgi:ankyrin repeat protein
MQTTSVFFSAMVLQFSLTFGQGKGLDLYKAISSNDSTRVKELVKDSSDANLVFSQGPWMKISMLIAAVNQGNLTNVRHLLRNGADPNWQDGFKSTAIMYAAHQGDLSIVKLLVEYI